MCLSSLFLLLSSSTSHFQSMALTSPHPASKIAMRSKSPKNNHRGIPIARYAKIILCSVLRHSPCKVACSLDFLIISRPITCSGFKISFLRFNSKNQPQVLSAGYRQLIVLLFAPIRLLYMKNITKIILCFQNIKLC